MQSRQKNDAVELEEVMNDFMEKLNSAPEVLYAFSSYTANSPHVFIDFDRLKAETMGISTGRVFDILQAYFGTYYVNDINLGAQVNKVMIQSDWQFRDKLEVLNRIYLWSVQTYHEQSTQGQFMLVIAAAVVFGYLFLVAQYESWPIPMAVMLSLPVAVLGALTGIMVMQITISIYTQPGILLPVGLASRNAILIIEFAKEERELRGASIIASAAEAARERFRSVLMTAFTCVLGVAPMLFASGAGAQSRIHVGTTMFFGMTVATVFGIF